MRFFFILMLMLCPLAVAAQQTQQPPDDKLAVAMQLLTERTGQVIELAAEVQKLTKLLKASEAAKDKPADKEPKP